MKLVTVLRRYKFIIFFIFFILLFFIFHYQYKQQYLINESFETIVSDLNSNNTGFYAMFFKILNQYLYSKNNNKNFRIDSSGWVFKIDKGWEDYFETTELKFDNEGEETINYTNSANLQDFTIGEYKNAIPELYKYNQRTKDEINKMKISIKLPSQYDSIFIRRGDKLANESKFLETNDYIKLLLKKNPDCKNIFLQTDDYNCYLDLKKYILDNKLNIRSYTLCEKNSVGAVMHSYRKDELSSAMENNPNNENKKYLSSIMKKLKQTKPVEEMSSEEKYNHVINMISGIDIVINSNVCTTDYQSNVARFIKLKHKNPSNVYNIMDENNDIDYNKNATLINSF